MERYFKKESIEIYVCLVLVLVLSIPTIFPLFHSGFFEFHDNTQVVRVYEMGKSLSYGIFPVRWVPDLGYGYGYPIFNFYAPVSYYIGGIFVLLGLNALVATKVMFGIGILLSGVTMFFLSRKFFGNYAGVLSGIIYMYFPYHAVNIYVRGAVDEFFAYAFLPLAFLGVLNLIETEKGLRKNLNNILMISFGIFFISISHNLTLYMTLLLLIPAFFVIFFHSKNRKIFISVFISAIIFGLLLSSFYILPAFLEMHYTNVSSVVGGGSDYNNHFVCIQQFWNSPWGFGGSTKGCVDGFSFKLGKIEILITAAAIILWVFNLIRNRFRIQEKSVLVTLVVLVFSIFLTLPYSSFVWEALPYMSYLQFPWRFLNFIGLSMAFISGYFLFAGSQLIYKKFRLIFLALMSIGVIFYSYKLFVPQFYTNHKSSFYTQKSYINFTVSKISDEYLPVDFVKPTNESQIPIKKAFFYNGEGVVKLTENKITNYVFNIETKTPSLLHLNIAYFPAWQAYLNGQQIRLDKSGTGMDINLPRTKGSIDLKFIQTRIEQLSNLLTIIAFLGVVIGIMFVRRKKNYAK